MTDWTDELQQEVAGRFKSEALTPAAARARLRALSSRGELTPLALDVVLERVEGSTEDFKAWVRAERRAGRLVFVPPPRDAVP